MKLSQAEEIAQEKLQQLLPFCDRVEVAGSLRRRKEEIKDIELVVIPKMIAMGDLFDANAKQVSVLELNSSPTRKMEKLIKNGEKYKQIELPERINLDLFIVTPPAQWGVIFAIRTGPADFSHWLVTSERQQLAGAMPYFAKCENGGVYASGLLVVMPEENDFFKFLKIPFVAPELRRAPEKFLLLHKNGNTTK